MGNKFRVFCLQFLIKVNFNVECKNKHSRAKKYLKFIVLIVETERVCQNWFKKFGSGDFLFKSDQRSSQTFEVDGDGTKAIIESNIACNN